LPFAFWHRDIIDEAVGKIHARWQFLAPQESQVTEYSESFKGNLPLAFYSQASLGTHK
jgi:hypothetical protein